MNYKSLIIDHLDELSAGTQKSADMCKVAGLAEPPSSAHAERLDDGDFGLVILKQGNKFRKFPLDSRANALLSKESFLRNKNKLTMGASGIAEARIKMACVRYDLDDQGLHKSADVGLSPFYLHTHIVELNHATRVKNAQMVKEAGMKKFAIDATTNGHLVQKFPINSVDEVKTAAEAVSSKLPIQWFLKAAHNILDQAKEMNIVIDSEQEINIVKNASLSEFFPGEIRKRIRLTGGEEAIQYMNLSKTAQDGDLSSAAVALENLDVANRLRPKWGQLLMRPALAVFGLPKTAELIALDSGDVNADALASFVSERKEEIASAIGEDATNGLINTTVDSFNALPAPHRQYVSELFGGSA